ncbi:MAG: DUF3822 family protein [Cyclobacteriaceae bacterium]
MSTATDTSTHKLIKRVKDEKFSIDELEDYSLTLQVGVRDFQISVTDTQDNQVMALEDYKLEGIRTVNGRLRLIKDILDNHAFLTAGFWKGVKLCLKTHKFSLVPSNMFVADSAADYIAVNSEIKTSFEEINYYKQISTNTVNIFAAETKLCKWISTVYKQKVVHVIHQGSALIEGVLKHNDHSHERGMYCFIDRGILHVIVAEDKKLLFYNQYAVRKKEDYLKYIMLVFKEMEMDPKKSSLMLWGFIGQNSDEMNLLKKFIRNISLGSKPSFMKFGYKFDEIDDHQYFDVMSAYICA